MRTRHRIQAGIRDHQPPHRLAPDEVRLHNLIQVFLADPAVPHRFRIDHHVRPVLTLVKTPALVRAYSSFQPAFRQLCLQCLLKLRLSCGIATPARAGSVAHIRTYEDVSFKLRHGFQSTQLLPTEVTRGVCIYESGLPLSFSSTLIGATSGCTSASRGTMNVCSSAKRPLSAACGTPSV
jgi:hypothetical protein